MLTYNHSNKRQSTLIDFDFQALLKASNLLLGKEKTDEFKEKSRTDKGFLNFLAELEYQADQVSRNPEKELPEDAPKFAFPTAAKARRGHAADDILEWDRLNTSSPLANNLSYRIRGANQLAATFENKLTIDENGSFLQVSLKNLRTVIEQAEKTGVAQVTINTSSLTAKELEALQKGVNNLEVFIQDELAERPEVKRIWIGNLVRRCQSLARERKTTPEKEMENFLGEYSGKHIPLSKNAQVTIDSATNTLKVTFPEVTKAITEAQDIYNRDQATEKKYGSLAEVLDFHVKGKITDGMLNLHTAASYGCNGRDFIEALPEITAALTKNLEEATKVWFNIEGAPTNSDKLNFLKEYGTLSLTLRNSPTPKQKLEKVKTYIKSLKDLATSRERDPEEVYTREITSEARPFSTTSCVASAGEEWLDSLSHKTLDEIYNNAEGAAYSESVGKTFNIENAKNKQQIIEANFHQTSIIEDGKTIQPLDGEAKNLVMHSHFLTEEMEEEFQQKKEESDQEEFDSKSEAAIDEATGAKKQKLDKVDWLEGQGVIAINIPNNPVVLKKMTRYEKEGSKQRTLAESFDRSISMPKTSTLKEWSVPTKNGALITLKDCLTEKALKKVDEANKLGDDNINAMVTSLVKLLAELQSDKRKLNKYSKNPIERKLCSFLEKIATGVDNENEKFDSVEEASTLLSTPISNCGKLPYFSDMEPEHFDIPVRSSTIPLKLLCGTGEKELDNIYKDTKKVRDIIMRVKNAKSITTDTYNKKESNIEILEKVINEGEAAIIAHATLMELSSTPNFKKEYLDLVGLPKGAYSLNKDIQSLGDIILPLSASPKTMGVLGEETPIDDLLTYLKEKEGVDISLTPEELKEVDNAPQSAINNWRNSCEKVITLLNNINTPNNKNAELTILIESEEEEELTGFEDILTTMEKILPNSNKEKEDILKALLTNNPNEIKVTLLSEKITVKKGSGGEWRIELDSKIKDKIASPEAIKAVERIQEASDLINKTEKSPEEVALLEKATMAATQSKALQNISVIETALKAIPEHLATQHNVSEVIKSLKPIPAQVAQITRAEKIADTLLTEWINTNEKENEKEEVGEWGWGKEQIFNAEGMVDYLCDKITGETASETKEVIPSEDSKKDPKYFVKSLFTKEEKQKATDLLTKEGKSAAALFLKGRVEDSLSKIKGIISKQIPENSQKLSAIIQATIAKSKEANVVEYFTNDPKVSALLRDKVKYVILQNKIEETRKELAKTKGAVSFKGVTTHDQVGREILPGLGSKENLQLAVKIEGGEVKITTNKLWATAWLTEKTGNLNIQKRINLANWIKENGENIKTSIAFLEFLRQRQLSQVSEAIAANSLTEVEAKAIKEGLQHFSNHLEEMGIKKDGTLFTKLHGGLALSQYADKGYLWSKNDQYKLIGVSNKNGVVKKSADLSPSFSDKKLKDETAIIVSSTSPYKKENLIAKGEGIREEIDQAAEAEKLNSVIRAVGVIDTPVPYIKKKKTSKVKEDLSPAFA